MLWKKKKKAKRRLTQTQSECQGLTYPHTHTQTHTFKYKAAPEWSVSGVEDQCQCLHLRPAAELRGWASKQTSAEDDEGNPSLIHSSIFSFIHPCIHFDPPRPRRPFPSCSFPAGITPAIHCPRGCYVTRGPELVSTSSGSFTSGRKHVVVIFF